MTKVATDEEILGKLLEDDFQNTEDSWALYSKKRKLKGKAAQEAFRAGFAFGRKLSATNMLNTIRWMQESGKKAPKKKRKY